MMTFLTMKTDSPCVGKFGDGSEDDCPSTDKNRRMAKNGMLMRKSWSEEDARRMWGLEGKRPVLSERG